MSTSSGILKPSPEVLYSVLLTAKNRLEYLTPNDWALIADKSQRLKFAKDDVLIHKGKQPHQVFMLMSGRARVESAPGAKVAQIAEGEICGEMSFLEGSFASASVI